MVGDPPFLKSKIVEVSFMLLVLLLIHRKHRNIKRCDLNEFDGDV
jgi:hypothetical protein